MYWATNKVAGIWAATVGALLAFLIVVVLGIVVHGPLTKIPENTLKFTVGIMLVTFGTFWAGEGLGIEWPFADLFLFVLVAFYLIFSIIIGVRRRNLRPKRGETSHEHHNPYIQRNI